MFALCIIFEFILFLCLKSHQRQTDIQQFSNFSEFIQQIAARTERPHLLPLTVCYPVNFFFIWFFPPTETRVSLHHPVRPPVNQSPGPELSARLSSLYLLAVSTDTGPQGFHSITTNMTNGQLLPARAPSPVPSWRYMNVAEGQLCDAVYRWFTGFFRLPVFQHSPFILDSGFCYVLLSIYWPIWGHCTSPLPLIPVHVVSLWSLRF